MSRSPPRVGPNQTVTVGPDQTVIFIALTGWHRDYARTALRDALKLKVLSSRKPRGPTYGSRIMVALVKCWPMTLWLMPNIA